MTWQSSLQLGFDKPDGAQKTRLFHRLHTGALMVQRPLYPEPSSSQCSPQVGLNNQAGICHVYVLYPPAGIADKDKLTLSFELKPTSHAVITTPGAGKWYGQRKSLRQPKLSTETEPTDNLCLDIDSPSVYAEQHIHAKLDSNAILEWLPQESIYFDHSVSNACNQFHLADSASLLTWEIAVFGRQAYAETFANGHYSNRLEIWRHQHLLVSENTHQQANSRWFHSALGLNSQHVHGSFWAVPSMDVLTTANQANPLKLGHYLDEVVTDLRACIDDHHLPVECTHNYQAINCRYLGADVRACFDAFYQLRERLRAKWYGLEPHRPRIWDT